MTDLMTALMVIFILLLVSNLNNMVAQTARANSQNKVIKSLIAGNQTKRDELRKAFEKLDIQADPDPNDPLMLVIRIGYEKLKFDIDSSELKSAGKEYLQGFVPKFVKVLSDPQFSRDLESILIVGHTDSDGIDEHNLRLSQDRSYSVLLYVLNDCNLNPTVRARFLQLISANGRGESELIFDKLNGAERKDESRRVAIQIRVKSIEQQRDPELIKLLQQGS